MELLIKAVSASHTDPEQDLLTYKKGDIVEVRDNGAAYGRKECPPLFVVVKCPGVTKEQAVVYMKHWSKQLDYTVLSANNTTGVYQLSVFADEVSASGLNALTREKVEEYLISWGAVVNSIAANKVVFTVRLWPMLQSNGFWGVDVSDIVFTLQSYDAVTGIAIVNVDYSASGYASRQIAAAIKSKGGVILSASSFSINREQVIDIFKQDIKSRVDGVYKKRRYSFPPEEVDAALAAGGIVTLTAGQILDRIKDGLDD